MLVLSDAASIAGLQDTQLRELLTRRAADLVEYIVSDLSELVRFVIVEPGDTLQLIDAELGFSVLGGDDRTPHFGEPSFHPLFEVCEKHGSYYELVFIVNDGGEGVEVLVPNIDGIDADLLAMCEAYALPPGEDDPS
jgi:hypothetical protein